MGLWDGVCGGARTAAGAGRGRPLPRPPPAAQEGAGGGFLAGPELSHGDLNLFVILSMLVSGLCAAPPGGGGAGAGRGLLLRPARRRATRAASHARGPRADSRARSFDGLPKDLLDSWPALKAYRTKVASHPKARRIGAAPGLRGQPVAGGGKGQGRRRGPPGCRLRPPPQRRTRMPAGQVFLREARQPGRGERRMRACFAARGCRLRHVPRRRRLPRAAHTTPRPPRAGPPRLQALTRVERPWRAASGCHRHAQRGCAPLSQDRNPEPIKNPEGTLGEVLLWAAERKSGCLSATRRGGPFRGKKGFCKFVACRCAAHRRWGGREARRAKRRANAVKGLPSGPASSDGEQRGAGNIDAGGVAAARASPRLVQQRVVRRPPHLEDQ